MIWPGLCVPFKTPTLSQPPMALNVLLDRHFFSSHWLGLFLVAPDLGVFGKQMVDGDSSSGGDLALAGTFFVVVLVGTFASQVRGYRTPAPHTPLVYRQFLFSPAQT